MRGSVRKPPAQGRVQAAPSENEVPRRALAPHSTRVVASIQEVPSVDREGAPRERDRRTAIEQRRRGVARGQSPVGEKNPLD